LSVECTAPLDVLLARARARELQRDRVSDAGAAVIRRQLAELEPVREGSGVTRMELSTDAAPDRLVTQVEAFIDRSIWPAVATRAAGEPD
jgi:predicted kinase